MARIVKTILTIVRYMDVIMGLVLMALTRTHVIVVQASLVSYVRQTLMNAVLVSTHHNLILSQISLLGGHVWEFVYVNCSSIWFLVQF